MSELAYYLHPGKRAKRIVDRWWGKNLGPKDHDYVVLRTAIRDALRAAELHGFHVGFNDGVKSTNSKAEETLP